MKRILCVKLHCYMSKDLPKNEHQCATIQCSLTGMFLKELLFLETSRYFIKNAEEIISKTSFIHQQISGFTVRTEFLDQNLTFTEG